MPSELRVLNIIPNENLDFLNQETPYQVAEPLRGGLPPHKFEAILRTIHLVSTRRETFNKSSGCLCWTGVSIAKEFDQNLNVELNSNQKNMMISVQAYSSLKSYLMDDKE